MTPRACLAGGLYGFVSVVGVQVGVDIREVRAGGHSGGRGDRSEAAVELLPHGPGQRVDITVRQVAVVAARDIIVRPQARIVLQFITCIQSWT